MLYSPARRFILAEHCLAKEWTMVKCGQLLMEKVRGHREKDVIPKE